MFRRAAIPVMTMDAGDTKSELIVGDGNPRFDILSVTGKGAGRRVIARCTVPGRLMPSRGVVVTNSRAKQRSPITPKDRAALRVAAECDAEFVALSYVCAPEDIEQLREQMKRLDMRARIIAKIDVGHVGQHAAWQPADRAAPCPGP